jgi:hypothetical protein
MFQDALKLTLDLTIGNKNFKIPGGNVKNFHVDLYPYGFDAHADFWVSLDRDVDLLFYAFTGQDRIDARLSIQAVHNLPTPAPNPLIVKGLVTRKSVREVDFEEVEGQPVLVRRYEIHFRDAARVLWRQHFPTALYVNAKMTDVIEAQIVEGISLEMEWDALDAICPVICLGLGASGNGASFYDFLMWLVRGQNGVFAYDTKEHAYTLSNAKSRQRFPQMLRPAEIENYHVFLPEICRHDVNVMNAFSESPRSEEISQDQSVQGLRQDVLVRHRTAEDFDTRKTLEQEKLFQREHEVNISFTEFPRKTLRPGSLVVFSPDEWSKKIVIYGQSFRMYEIHITAEAKNQEANHDRDAEYTTYQVEMTANLEQKDNSWVYLPPFEPPRYPIFAEGKIVSEVGEDNDKSYMIYTDDDTSQDFYTVNVPVWNKKVKVPFVPDLVSGHFYFPAFKHSRVLLALHYDRVEISRFLDWGEGVRLPMDAQGNHVLFGHNATSETSMRHTFIDGKPVFSTKRVFGQDTELIQMEESAIILQTKEDESLEALDETFNVTPKVALTRAQLTMKNQEAVGEVTADFQATKAGVNAAIGGAIGNAEAELEAMDTDISGKVNEVSTMIETAMEKLSEKVGILKGKAESIKTELKQKIGSL